MTAVTSLSITEVARAFGLPISTLRYYDTIGLVPASIRRGRIRHYDREDLERLAYVQLWHADGALSIDRTVAIMSTTDSEDRNAMIERSRRELAERIAALTQAQEMLGHLTQCRYDEHMACPIVRGYLHERVDTALVQGQEASGGESVHAAMRRVKAGLTPGPAADDGNRRRDPQRR